MVLTSTARPKTAIVAWRRLSRRTELISQALDAPLWFFPDRPPYLKAFIKTFLKVIRERPRVLIVQLPQGPLLLEATLLKAILGTKVIADVHSGFLMRWEWKTLLLNLPFIQLLARSDLILIHNPQIADLLPRTSKNKAMVVYDPWYLVVMDQFPAAKNEKYLVFPASFAPDEPLEEVINAFSSNKSGLRLYITGNWKKAPEMRRLSSEKVIFAGFLPDSEYSALLAGSIAIITGTKQEYTVLMSAWEAVAYGKPLILSYSKTLKETFEDYPLYYHYDDPLSIKEIIDRAEDIQPDPRAREALLRKTMGSMDALKSALARW